MAEWMTLIPAVVAIAVVLWRKEVIVALLCIFELDMSVTVTAQDVQDFLADASWAICTTHHTVLKASPGAALFGRDMMFDILFLTDW